MSPSTQSQLNRDQKFHSNGCIGTTKADAAHYIQVSQADHWTTGKEKEQATREQEPSLPAATGSHWLQGITNMQAAKKSVAFICDVKEEIIQLIIDAHVLQLDPSVAFSTAESLSQVVLDVIHSPARLEELRAKVNLAQDQQQDLAADGEAVTSGASQLTETGEKKKQCCWVAGCERTKEDGFLAEMSEISQSTEAFSSASPKSSKSFPASSSEFQTNATTGNNGKTPSKLNSTSPAAKCIPAKNEVAEAAAPKVCTSSPSPCLAASEPPTAEMKQRVKELAAENRRLKYRKLCRKCKKVDLADSGITFLPCGHFITCEACSETFDDCPACGVNIMGTVRTYLS